MEPNKELMAEAISNGTCSLGIEFGSTCIKAVLIDRDMSIVASGSHVWENKLVDGYWTYSESDIWDGLASCYANLKQNVKAEYGVTIERLVSMGISAMMHGYLPFDANGKLLVPFRTWRNTTTTNAAKLLSELFAFHIPERWSISHLTQAMLDREPHIEQVDFLTTLAGFVHWRLTGEKVLSVGDASGMFPIDSQTGTYDSTMIEKFNVLSESNEMPWKVIDLLPAPRPAGQQCGMLTPEGALLLDPEGDLMSGTALCPPEGDAGTGMIATNSIAPRTGNVSAGTSIFSMIVLEHPLKDATVPEIDMVTTPVGDPVAMVHCNNCTSDINMWVRLLRSFTDLLGVETDRGEVFTKLFENALNGAKDGGGLVSIPFISGETVMGVNTGFPMMVRLQNAEMNVANLMRTNIMAAFASLAVGNEALVAEGVRIDKLYGHGGIFKTPKVAQGLLAAALDAPVTVMHTAGEGGAWGQAIAASYMVNRAANQSLSSFLDERVFAGMKGETMEPNSEDVAGFKVYLENFKKVNEAQKRAEEVLA